MKKSHHENIVGPWARKKLDGLESYLRAYTTALKNKSFHLVYIDAFAGAGKSMIRNAWEGADDQDLQLLDDKFLEAEAQFIEGSPRRALKLENSFSQLFFFDADPGRASLLRGLQSEFPGCRIDVRNGDANALIQDLVPQVAGRSTKGVAFLDPYGPHLHWRTLEALAATGSFEAIINFPLGMAINRLITRSGDIPRNWRSWLDNCFGGNEWEALAYSSEPNLFGETDRQKVNDAAKRLLDHYVGQLKDLFGHVASPMVVSNTRGVPIYYMLWAGPHPLGLKIAEHILSKGDRVGIPTKRGN